MATGKVKYMCDGSLFYDYQYYSSAQDANLQLKGGLVICKRVEEDTGGRLRVHKLYATLMDECDEGRLDLFTYTRSSVELKPGFYICRIAEIKRDQNNYVNMVVNTLTYLGEKIGTTITFCDGTHDETDKPVWLFLMRKMSPIAFSRYRDYYCDRLVRFNVSNAYSKGFTGENVIARLLAGDVAVLDELSDALLEPTELERAKAYIQANHAKAEFAVSFSLLLNKFTEMKDSEIIPFLERKLQEFEVKGIDIPFPESITQMELILFKVEAVLKYWKQFNLAKKADKNAARKAAKAAKATKV